MNWTRQHPDDHHDLAQGYTSASVEACAPDEDGHAVAEIGKAFDRGSSNDESPQRFCVDSADKANWVVRRVLAAREYAVRVKAWAEAERSRAAREEEQLLFLFGEQLHAWVIDELARGGGRRKSIALPGGTVGFRTGRPALIIRDEFKVLEWARRSLPEAVQVQERVAKSVINAFHDATTEMPPGTEMTSERECFYIR